MWPTDPPTNSNLPPERDVNPLMGLRYGPGHEKFPSWPIPASHHAPIAKAHTPLKDHLPPRTGSFRSKSWAEQTDYPKEARNHYCRPAQTAPQQLRTLIENDRPITTEHIDILGEKDSAHTSWDERGSGYAASEGYHSFVSTDSSVGTPFLDQLLRRDAHTTYPTSHVASDTLSRRDALPTRTTSFLVQRNLKKFPLTTYRGPQVGSAQDHAPDHPPSIAARVLQLEGAQPLPHADPPRPPQPLQPSEDVKASERSALREVQKKALLAYYERLRGKDRLPRHPFPDQNPSPCGPLSPDCDRLPTPSQNFHLLSDTSPDGDCPGTPSCTNLTKPQRPPKKPHLRLLPPQCPLEPLAVPPPRLPRATVGRCPQPTTPPPRPSKPRRREARCPSPDLPPPPPPPTEDTLAHHLPLPPPPSPLEVEAGPLRASHQDLPHLTRTPSVTPAKPLSPTGWEEFHNIRPQSTTLVFTSNGGSRGASWGGGRNPFNNKTGSSQSRPPVAQVAPLLNTQSHPTPLPFPVAGLGLSPSTEHGRGGDVPLPGRDSADQMPHSDHSMDEEGGPLGVRPSVEAGTPRKTSADSVHLGTCEWKSEFRRQQVEAVEDGKDHLRRQKEELVCRMSRKLGILRIEQTELGEEMQGNEALGQALAERVRQAAKGNEFAKFRLHVDDIDKITSLLLGLSNRLARAENALMVHHHTHGLSNMDAQKVLERKRDRLLEQLDEAKGLKENIDRRAAQVGAFLEKYLSQEDLADYHHFTRMKAKLIVDARDIHEKIQLGEEQMGALEQTLLPSAPSTNLR